MCGNQVRCRGVLEPAHTHSHLLRRADCAAASLPNSLFSDVTLIVSIDHDETIYINQDFSPRELVTSIPLIMHIINMIN